MINKYAYFPGCSMESVGRAYASSLAAVNYVLGLEFTELNNWNCCGATAAHTTNPQLALALPARNLDIAKEQLPGVPLVAACASCYSRLKYAARQKQYPYEIYSVLDVYTQPQVSAAISAAICQPLQNLQAACYYGCLFSRPAELTGAVNGENPRAMDELLALTGAKPVEWAFKTECCGAAKHMDAPKAALPLLRNIYQNARANGAKALVTACPMCMMNLDMRQKTVNKGFKENFALPVYYITEVLAMAMGCAKGAKKWPG